jgi:hypothetical protein
MKYDDNYNELLRRLKRAADALDDEQRVSRATARVIALFKRSIATLNRNAEAVTGQLARRRTRRARKKGADPNRD